MVNYRRALKVVCVVVLPLGVLFLTRNLTWIDQCSNPCQVKCAHYSPAYPSAGGPGCSPKCIAREGEKNSSYVAVFYNSTHSWPKGLVQNMHLAATILKKYSTPTSIDTERRIYLHVSFDYYCCYTPEEAAKIGDFLNSYVWEPHKVWFDRLVCAIHSTGDMVSLVLMVDEYSQKELLKWALDSERDLEAKTGVHKHIPHTDLQGFHMTLATVNQSVFPVQPAVHEINRIILPGHWHSSPVILHRPLCKKCSQS